MLYDGSKKTFKRGIAPRRFHDITPPAHKDEPAPEQPVEISAENKCDIQAADILAETDAAFFMIPVFLSYATPYNALESEFLAAVIEQMRENLLFPRTLGRSDQYTETPLTSIRRMVLSSYGLLAVAFRRTFVEQAASRPGTAREQTFTNFWLTNPYLQIEPSMAYQQGLPIVLFVESGVSTNSVFGGILEQGGAPFTIITFSLNSEQDIPDFFNSVFWKETFLDWTGNVRDCYDLRTQPDLNCGGC